MRRQIELVAPKILVCLGRPSAQTLLDSKEGIMRLRGRWFDYAAGEASDQGDCRCSIPPISCASRPQKKLAWRDLRLLAKEIARLHAPSSENFS